MQEELVTVAAYSQAMKAEAAKNFLQGHGIRAFVADENVAVTLWPNLAETKLQVAADDADRAKKLLVQHHAGEDVSNEGD